MTTLRIDILTLFPEIFAPVLSASIPGRAIEAGLVGIHAHNIRDWSADKHRRVDDRPFGGGPGMVMMCQPLYDAVLAVEAMDERRAARILLTPQGRLLDQPLVETLVMHERLLLIAGHYEGIDERVIDELQPLEISIGDYVLSGGELPALVLVDAIVRLIPGALGHEDSAAEDSFGLQGQEDAALRAGHRSRTEVPPAASAENSGSRLLDSPHFTRPRVWRGRHVPDVLVSGDHAAVAAWRRNKRMERTIQRRPDLVAPSAPAAGT